MIRVHSTCRASVLVALLAFAGCGSLQPSSTNEDPTISSDLAAAPCALSATNRYTGVRHRGTVRVQNGGSVRVTGFSVDFNAPGGGQCTDDVPLPEGGALTTNGSHCHYDFTGSIAAGSTLTFSYSADSGRSASPVTTSACKPIQADRCGAPGLVWRTASKTTFTSYPDPGSDDCIKYSGCQYAGMFAACTSIVKSKAWVQAHNIAAVFPDFGALGLHDLCIKSGTTTMIVTTLDQCADSDCSGCCTAWRGTANELIELESFTDARFGVPNGPIEWADLGPTTGGGCN
jgi:hypothetical protein